MISKFINFKNLSLYTFLFLSLFGVVARPAIAAQENDDRYIYELSPYIEIADKVEVKNPINSDAILIGTNVKIDAPVEGDLFVVAETIEVDAPIKGNLRVIASSVTLSSYVEKSFSFIALTVNIKATGEIEKDAYGAVQNLTHDGRIGGNLNISFDTKSRAIINGKVIKNVYHTEGIIEGTKQLIQGSIVEIKDTYTAKDERKDILIGNLFSSLSLIVVYLFIRKIRPQIFNLYLQKSNYFKVIAKGLVGFLGVFLISFIAAITLIGFPISIMVMTFTLFSIYIAPIFAALLVGKMIFRGKELNFIQIVISILLVNVVFIAPTIGNLAIILSSLLSLGILIEYILKKTNE